MAKGLAGRSRLSTGVLIVALALVAGFVFLWRRQPTVPGSPAAAARTGAESVLVATVRSEPRSFNRFVARDRASLLVSLLVHARLVRLNLQTQEIEPSLAERWTTSADGRTVTLQLRRGVTFADGTPFTSADVLFSFQAVYDERVGSPLAEPMKPGGEPIAVTAPDDHTVVLTFARPFGPGVRVLENLPILPKRRLAAALDAGSFRDAWGLGTPPAEMTGLGPFVLQEYRRGERLVFARNARYWKADERGTPLPYLSRLVLEVVPDQGTERLRLESGQADLTTGEVRPDDVAAMRRASDAGRVRLVDLGVALDADGLWFNLSPAWVKRHQKDAWLQRRELREAISIGVDRTAFANAVFLGAADPVWGPVTPGNKQWFDGGVPRPGQDPARARQLLSQAGLADRDGDGLLEAPDGTPAGFAIITQKGNTLRERAVQYLQEALRGIGLTVDVVTLEQPAVIDRFSRGDYDAIYFGFQSSDTDPGLNLDYWLSSGAFHVWNPQQHVPATAWEARTDDVMRRQVETTNVTERQRMFGEVQRIFAEQQPVIYFAAPRVHIATSSRVKNARPGLLQPPVLWDAERLAVN